jgi:hypothetical protein
VSASANASASNSPKGSTPVARASRDVAPTKPPAAATPAPLPSAPVAPTSGAAPVTEAPAAEPPKPTDTHVEAPQSFGDLRTVIAQRGDATKGREMDALLSFEASSIVVRSRESGAVLKTMPYGAIAAATYIQAKRPKGSDETNVAAIPPNFVGSNVFSSEKHWLTLQTTSDFLILRLDDKNYRSIVSSFEARTGRKTQRPQS